MKKAIEDEYWDAERDVWLLVDPDVPAEVQSAWISTHGRATEPATYGTIDLRAGDAYVLRWGGDLDDKPDARLSVDDLALLDRIAELTLHADARFDELRRFYTAADHG